MLPWPMATCACLQPCTAPSPPALALFCFFSVTIISLPLTANPLTEGLVTVLTEGLRLAGVG